MITFSPTTYGKDTAVRIPELEGLEKSVQRRGEMAIKTEELKLEKALSNKKEFEKALAVDPVAAISKANTVRQALAIEKYNNAVAGLYAKNNGELTYADQIAVANAKNDLSAFQNRLLAEENEYKEAEEISRRDTRGYYDKNHFDKARMAFLETGERPKEGFLKVNAVNPTQYLAKYSPSLGEVSNTIIEDVKDAAGNILGKNQVQMKYRMTKEEAAQQIASSFQEEPVALGYIKEFESLPESEQLKWLKDYDKTNIGVIDPAERNDAYADMTMLSNPIVQWATQNKKYLDAAMGGKAYKSTPVKQIKTEGGGGYEVYGERTVSSDYGSLNVNSWINFGKFTETVNKQLATGVYVQDPATGQFTLKPHNKGLKFDVMGYSPKEDILVVTLIEDSDPYSKGETLMLPAKDYDDLLKKKPWFFDRNKERGKLGIGTGAVAKEEGSLNNL